MGVQRLTTFAKNQRHSNIYHGINILDEICRFKAAHGKPTIIFDVMGFIHNFGNTITELNLGGRQHIYLQKFEQFLIRLRTAGAALAFFCDGQLQSNKNDEWCRRRDFEFKSTQALISDESRPGQANRRFGCKAFVKSLLKLVEDKHYGKVKISTQVDCDAAIAQYAVENNALAVVANDSDFLIFEGNFQWWEADSMDMEKMKAKCFQRQKLRQMLSLTNEQMKYFATIAGNDHTKQIVRKHCDFIEVAEFCRSINSKQCDDLIHSEIRKFMRIGQDNMKFIASSIRSYDINFTVENTCSQMDVYCSSNVLLYSFRNQAVFQYEVNFLDFDPRNNNNVPMFLDVLLKVFRKLGGILLKGTSHRNPMLKVVSKYSHLEKYMLKEHQPIYPQGDVNIKDLIFGGTSDCDEERWRLLLWSTGLDTKLQYRIENIPKPYILTVLALTMLHNADEITIMQADALLMSQYDIFESNIDLQTISIKDETKVGKDRIRIGQLFNRTITLLWDCFAVCGLKRFIQLDWFDGPYFNYLLTQFQRSHTCYNDRIMRVKEYRLYALEMP